MGGIREILVMVLLSVVPELSHDKMTYPLWFQRMPYMEGVYFAIGYAPRYTYLSSSFKEAKENLKKNLAYVRGVIIDGELGFLKENTQIAGVGGTIRDTTDTSGIHPVILDSAVCKDFVLVLGATKKADGWKAHLFNPPPLWFKEIPSSSNFFFAVGTAPLYAYEHDSWLYAEQNARYNLAMEIFTKIKALRKYHNETIQGITVESTSVHLRNVQVLARHIDIKNRSVYVLVGIPKK